MPQSSVDSQTTGWTRTAKRLVDWTTNLLVVGVLLLVGLTFGRQLTSWWAVAPERNAHTALDSSRYRDPRIDDETPSRLDFGDLPIQLGRQMVRGPRTTVLTTLRAQCRNSAERQTLSGTRLPGPQEQRMLQGMAGLTPVEQESGKWRMYQLDGPIPMVVVTDTAANSPTEAMGESARRVLSWGLAFPLDSGSEKWTLFTCVPAREPATSVAQPELPLPPGARRLMSLWTGDAEGTVMLAGPGEPRDWCDFFDAWFEQRGWLSEAGWRTVGGVMYHHYVNQAISVEILLENRGDLRGIVTVAPR